MQLKIMAFDRPLYHLYNRARPEHKAMESYISASSASGLIILSSSPIGVGFLFMKKKDGTLCTCSDYCGLNDIRICNKYLLLQMHLHHPNSMHLH